MNQLRRIGFSKLFSLEAVIEKLLPKINLVDIEKVKVSESLNRILVDNIISEIDIPPFDRAAMDGYAIKAEDSFKASMRNPKNLKLVGIIEVGEVSDLSLRNGEGIRISTGAQMPLNANAVIKIEDTELESDNIALFTSITPRKNVAMKGEDIKNGELILEKGIQIKPEHIALLSSIGYKEISVRAKPVVSIFSTGNELIEVGQPLQPGKIYNSNTAMLKNLVEIYGGSVERMETLPDDIDLIKTKMIESTQLSQIVIFTGGTSVGTKDFLPEVVRENGEILVHGVAIKPGSPILIGFVNNTLIFCLPGTPVAAYIGFLYIIGISIRKMMNCSVLDPRIQIQAIIEKDVPVSSLGYTQLLRVKLNVKNNYLAAIPLKLKGSGIITSLTQADGIVEIPPNQEGLRKGEIVTIKLFPK